MPELPEVETIARDLQAQVTGRRIQRVEIRRDSVVRQAPQEFSQHLQRQSFLRIERRAKYLLFQLEQGWMLGHLAMSGKFIYESSPNITDPYARVLFWLEGGGCLIFSEIRCFGFVEWVADAPSHPRLALLGPDALALQTAATLKARAQGRQIPIKVLLLDQHFLAGIGNIYASEILFLARIRPTKGAQRLTLAEWGRLAQAIPEILQQALNHNGTTISDYRRVDDKTGEFQNFLQVYQREGQPCRICQNPIQKLVQAQRSSFFCSECQA